MNASIAADFLGGEMPGTTTFANMVRALQMHSWLNSDEETMRLEAALWARRHKKELAAEMDKRRMLRARGRTARRHAAYLAMQA